MIFAGHHPWLEKEMVGTTGFEPATSWSQTKRSTRLSHVPNHSYCPSPWRREQASYRAASLPAGFQAPQLPHQVGVLGGVSDRFLQQADRRGPVALAEADFGELGAREIVIRVRLEGGGEVFRGLVGPARLQRHEAQVAVRPPVRPPVRRIGVDGPL